MLSWALLFLIIALLAGLFGFTTIFGPMMFAAKVLFFVFLVMFVLSLVLGNRTTHEGL